MTVKVAQAPIWNRVGLNLYFYPCWRIILSLLISEGCNLYFLDNTSVRYKGVMSNLSRCIYLSIECIPCCSSFGCTILSCQYFIRLYDYLNGSGYYCCWCTLKTAIHTLWTRKRQTSTFDRSECKSKLM